LTVISGGVRSGRDRNEASVTAAGAVAGAREDSRLRTATVIPAAIAAIASATNGMSRRRERTMTAPHDVAWGNNTTSERASSVIRLGCGGAIEARFGVRNHGVDRPAWQRVGQAGAA
jgi:hypothetical protein